MAITYEINPFTGAFDSVQDVSGIDSRVTTLEGRYVRLTRFEVIGTNTTGTVTIGTNESVILDDFGGGIDAVISGSTAGKPNWDPLLSTNGTVLTTTFASNGAFTVSLTHTNTDACIVYRTRIPFQYYDDTETNVVGSVSIDPTHSQLAGLQGDTNYQHITSAQVAELHAKHYGGVSTMPSYTNNSNGTISFGSNGVGNFFTNTTGTSHPVQLSIPAYSNIALTDGSVNYIYADYNSGSPVYAVTTSPSAFTADYRLVPFLRVIRNGNMLHILDYDTFGEALPTKLFYKDVATDPFNRQSGLVLSTAATRVATISSGSAWFGVQLFTLDQNTGAGGTNGILIECYLTSGTWNYSAVTNYDSTYYSDGTNRQSLATGKYVAKYFFRGVEVDNHAYFVHGNTYNHISDALAESVPILPTMVTGHALYVGKIIIAQGASNGTAYPVDWVTGASLTATSDHNNLAGLQGGTSSQYYHLTAADYNVLTALTTIQRDPTGFPEPTNVSVTYVASNSNVVVGLTNTALYYKGAVVTAMTNGWASPAHGTNTNVTYFLEYDGTNFIWSENGPSDFTDAFIAHATPGRFGLRECHGVMPCDAHRSLHWGVGTIKIGTGGTLSNFTLSSTTAANRRPYVSSCLVLDEDCPTTVAAISTNSYTTAYLTGSITGTNVGTVTFNTNQADIVPLSSNQPYFNDLSTGTASQTLMSANRFMSVWLIAVPVTADATSQNYRYIWLQGQAQTATLALEQAVTSRSLDVRRFRQIIPEFVVIGRLILNYTSGNWTIVYTEEITGSSLSQTSSPGAGGISSVNSETNTFSGLGTPSSQLTLNSNFATVSTNNALTLADVDATHTISSTNASTATTNGALVVSGGVGVAGNICIGGGLKLPGTAPSAGYIGEVISAAITDTTATTNDTAVTLANGLVLDKGRWEIFYNCLAYYATGTSLNDRGQVRVWVYENNAGIATVVGKTLSSVSCRTVAATGNDMQASLSSSCIVDVTTGTKDYRLGCKRLDGVGTGSATVYGGDFGTFYAIRRA